MTNILDYLEWRGDLSLSQDPFNAVDSLILSQLVYMDFDRILTENDYVSLLPLAETVRRLLQAIPAGERLNNNYMCDPKTDRRFLTLLAGSRRFGSMQLTRYVNHIDHKLQKQFCAMTIFTGDDSLYIAYRGTDASLVGWKENFNMSFMTPVPAQEEAVSYLESVALDFPDNIRLGGHSKGGNLAVYASAYCPAHIQNWLLAIYSHDGPGFDKQVITSDGYLRVQKRIHTFVPQTSIIGMLLEHEESYTVIHSSGSGIFQHDPYSWDILGRDFIRLESIDANSQRIDRAIRSWINGLDYSQRESLVEGIYHLFTTSEPIDTSEETFSVDRLKSLRSLLKSMTSMDEDTKAIISQALSALWHSARSSSTRIRRKSK